MKTLNVNVADKIATYQTRDGVIICGNSDYQIQFAFDEEWETHNQKTARFEWNGQYHDVEFTGNVCQVPVIRNTSKVYVGVYVGETPEDTLILSTTRCEIPCGLSVRCGDAKADDDTGANYTNEAKGAAAEAKAAAEQAQTAMENIEQYKGLEKICSWATNYDEPYWQEGSDCRYTQITKEQYDLFSKARIVNIFINPWYDTYYEAAKWVSYLVNIGHISEYGDIGDSGEAMYVAVQKASGEETYFLCATTSAFTKCILPGTQNHGMAAQFDFYG